MRKRSYITVPLVLAAVLTGSAGCSAELPSSVDDLTKVVDLIPWAKSVADIASAEQLTERLDELAATLPTLDIPETTKTALVARVDALKAEVLENPDEFAARVAELGAIIADVQSALGE